MCMFFYVFLWNWFEFGIINLIFLYLYFESYEKIFVLKSIMVWDILWCWRVWGVVCVKYLDINFRVNKRIEFLREF